MNAPLKQTTSTEDEVAIAVAASICRALEQAPLERKLPIFTLLVRSAADEIAARRQQSVDGLWWVAEQVGLVKLLGTTAVQEALNIGFDGRTL